MSNVTEADLVAKISELIANSQVDGLTEAQLEEAFVDYFVKQFGVPVDDVKKNLMTPEFKAYLKNMADSLTGQFDVNDVKLQYAIEQLKFCESQQYDDAKAASYVSNKIVEKFNIPLADAQYIALRAAMIYIQPN